MNYRVSPFGALNELSRELNRFFDDDRRFSASLVDSSSWTPHVDISETADSFKVVADLPGVKPEDIEISLHKGLLTIRGERSSDEEVEKENFSRRERFRGTFLRQFNLPESADEETVSARSNNGVLEVTIPKAKQTQPISIAVDEG